MYIRTSCFRMPQFAVRATLFSCECLCGRGQFGEAAKQLIRMTSEDSDLRSALLLEQAAYCFLASPRLLMPRKYAFHLVLAGHRFSKAGQKKHSLRCYRQAYQVTRPLLHSVLMSINCLVKAVRLYKVSFKCLPHFY